MSESTVLARQRLRSGGDRPAVPPPYTARDLQLEVLERLEEMHDFTESLEDSWTKKLEAVKEQRLLKFDSRTLIALGAIALSISGYVIQDARSSARQESEIEATKARVIRLEQIAATNTESRIRTEVQLGELREGQNEIKALIQTHDGATKKSGGQKQ
jgi:soluble cytochrome b562